MSVDIVEGGGTKTLNGRAVWASRYTAEHNDTLGFAKSQSQLAFAVSQCLAYMGKS